MFTGEMVQVLHWAMARNETYLMVIAKNERANENWEGGKKNHQGIINVGLSSVVCVCGSDSMSFIWKVYGVCKLQK